MIEKMGLLYQKQQELITTLEILHIEAFMSSSQGWVFSNMRWTWSNIWSRSWSENENDHELRTTGNHSPRQFLDGTQAVAFSVATLCHLEPETHEIGKINTQKIEWKNLNFRTWIKCLTRRTICFSKLETMHDIVIVLLINKGFGCDTHTESLVRPNTKKNVEMLFILIPSHLRVNSFARGSTYCFCFLKSGFVVTKHQ